LKVVICDKHTYKSHGFYYLLIIDNKQIPVFRLNQEYLSQRLQIAKNYISYGMFMEEKFIEFEMEDCSLDFLHREVIRRYPELWM